MIKGTVLKYNQENINTDLIIPARYLNNSDPYHLAKHCMEDLDLKFHIKREKLGSNILVGGINFGNGSSREQAPIAIKYSGIDIVIASSFARIFYRNSINIGLSLIEFEEINRLNTGDDLNIDLKNGLLINNTKKESHKISKIPQFLQDIVDTGGLVNYARKLILEK
ncbi:MAG: 3-isopropylmalate dehydratase small subunit [Candidatus Lokiarchaeota archaeon]|nr:3-isopropylmalate dehydratase small subunit [Candidatus Lokiarchaeota archaeon]MBD3198738.1 3-isopropylmalate dehydratase small subunit [Candidatus Lokiarchaeota archaeon]